MNAKKKAGSDRERGQNRGVTRALKEGKASNSKRAEREADEEFYMILVYCNRLQ